MLEKLLGKKLEMTYVGVDDEEQIQRIVLEEKKSKPAEPFYKHFYIPGEE